MDPGPVYRRDRLADMRERQRQLVERLGNAGAPDRGIEEMKSLGGITDLVGPTPGQATGMTRTIR